MKIYKYDIIIIICVILIINVIDVISVINFKWCYIDVITMLYFLFLIILNYIDLTISYNIITRITHQTHKNDPSALNILGKLRSLFDIGLKLFYINIDSITLLNSYYLRCSKICSRLIDYSLKKGREK